MSTGCWWLPLHPWTFPKADPFRAHHAAGGMPCHSALSLRPVLTLADNVLRDSSGKGVVLRHSPSLSWWAVSAAARSQSEVTGDAVALQRAVEVRKAFALRTVKRL